ncbi:MAG: D-alanyl-D-alanine carboxypeptidase family protein [Alphaproteobacteria bacterium]
MQGTTRSDKRPDHTGPEQAGDARHEARRGQRLRVRGLAGLVLGGLMVLSGVLAVGVAPAEARYASIVIDARTGQILHQENAATRNYPASLTKMMTLYLVFEALETGRLTMDQKLPVSRTAAGRSPSKLGLAAGSTISVRDAINALIVKSANDVATVVAEALGESERNFARRIMTGKARELGMADTTFQNASGLPNQGQLTTAADMARLVYALQRDFPKYYPLFSQQSFTWQGKTYRGHNRMLSSFSGTDGVKTGYIAASGFQIATSAVRNNRRLIGVVLGGRTAASRDAHMATLLNNGFDRISALPAILVAVKPGSPPLAIANDGPERSHGSQVGAVSRFAPAHLAATRALRNAATIVGAAHISVDEIAGDSGPLYRARLIGLAQNDAQRACALLQQRSMDCLVVVTGSGGQLASN